MTVKLMFARIASLEVQPAEAKGFVLSLVESQQFELATYLERSLSDMTDRLKARDADHVNLGKWKSVIEAGQIFFTQARRVDLMERNNISKLLIEALIRKNG